MDRRSVSEIFEPSFYSVISDRCRDNEAGQYDPDISAVKSNSTRPNMPTTEISIDSRLNSKIRVERFRSF